MSTLLATALVPGARAQTADAIIARNLAALGGLARIHAVRSERLIGTIEFPDGHPWPDTVDLARPGRIRTQLHIQGKTLVQAYDGHVAWTIDPFGPSIAPHRLSPGAAANVAAGGDMDGALVDYAAKGNRVTFAGLDTAAGRPAFDLRVITATGLTDHYFIDTTSNLITKWDGARRVRGKPVVFVSRFSDYRRVGGVLLPFRIDSHTRGQPGAQHIVITRVQLDVPEPASRFVMPGAARRGGPGRGAGH